MLESELGSSESTQKPPESAFLVADLSPPIATNITSDPVVSLIPAPSTSSLKKIPVTSTCTPPGVTVQWSIENGGLLNTIHLHVISGETWYS